MAVRIEKIICAVLHETYRRQVDRGNDGDPCRDAEGVVEVSTSTFPCNLFPSFGQEDPKPRGRIIDTRILRLSSRRVVAHNVCRFCFSRQKPGTGKELGMSYVDDVVWASIIAASTIAVPTSVSPRA